MGQVHLTNTIWKTYQVGDFLNCWCCSLFCLHVNLWMELYECSRKWRQNLRDLDMCVVNENVRWTSISCIIYMPRSWRNLYYWSLKRQWTSALGSASEFLGDAVWTPEEWAMKNDAWLLWTRYVWASTAWRRGWINSRWISSYLCNQEWMSMNVGTLWNLRLFRRILYKTCYRRIKLPIIGCTVNDILRCTERMLGKTKHLYSEDVSRLQGTQKE
jgi:hypothetical protein